MLANLKVMLANYRKEMIAILLAGFFLGVILTGAVV